MGAPEPSPLRQDTSDEELLLLAAGQQETLGLLYARYAPLIYGVATKSFDPATAEEIVQEVFLAAWRGDVRPRARHGARLAAADRALPRDQ